MDLNFDNPLIYLALIPMGALFFYYLFSKKNLLLGSTLEVKFKGSPTAIENSKTQLRKLVEKYSAEIEDHGDFVHIKNLNQEFIDSMAKIPIELGLDIEINLLVDD